MCMKSYKWNPGQTSTNIRFLNDFLFYCGSFFCWWVHDDGSLGHFPLSLWIFHDPNSFILLFNFTQRAFLPLLNRPKKKNLSWKEFTYLSYVFRATKTSPHSDSAFNIFNIILNPRIRSGIENDSPDYHNLTISGEIKLFHQRNFYVI